MATVDGAVAGFLVVEHLDDSVHVEEIAVHPDHEGRGLATALLDTAAAHARDHNRAAVTLTTFRDVPWNAPFYARRGFTVVDDADLTDELRAVRTDEDAHGLPADLRVVMRRPAP